MLSEIIPLILTYNEAPNLRRTLEPLAWAKEIVVVDSFSTDETLEITRSFPRARIVQRKFDNHTAQWNFGLGQCRTDWILALDADYVLPGTFAEELEALQSGETVNAYFARFRYCVLGHPLRGTLYPPRAVLFRKSCCQYVQDGHTQQLQINGQAGFLASVIDHDDRKPLGRWFGEQIKYTELEARHLLKTPNLRLKTADRVRKKIILAPALVFFYTLLGQGMILDGWPGWYYVFQRTFAELLLSLRLMEEKLKVKN